MRDSTRRRYVPRNPRWFNRLLRWSFGEWIIRAYGVETRGMELFEELKPPYVIVGNHVTTRDVFIVSKLVPEPVWWVSTDAHLRGRALRSLLGMVGTIPKSKAIPDIVTVDTIVKVIRKNRGVVGFYPEGQQCWDGRTQPHFQSTAKLFKLLQVPVVVAKIKGGWASLPRWTWKRRRGGLVVEFSRLLDTAELAAMDGSAIENALTTAIRHDELAWLEAEGRRYVSRRRAEKLELALFMCPSCSSIGSMRSEGNEFRCLSCGAAQRLDGSYRFRRLGQAEPRFADLREWYEWQSAAVGMLAFEAASEKSPKPLFSDSGVRLFRGGRMSPLLPLARGRLDLYFDRMELVVRGETHLVFHVAAVEGAGVLTRQTFEFYVGRHLYRMTFPNKGVSALKWQLAVEALKREVS